MASTDPHDCPGCGDTYPSRTAAASHAAQIADSDHPWSSWERAAEAVDSYGGNPGTTTADTDEPTPEGGGDEPAADRRPAVETDPTENPLLRMPSYADGAARIVCPECGEEMRPAGSGRRFVYEDDGEEVVAVTTDDDHICNGCRIIANETETYHNVK